MMLYEFGHVVILLAPFWVTSRKLRIIYNTFYIYKAEVFTTQMPVQNSCNV
jgi:hypothetical protein